MILINGSNMIKGRKNTSLVTYSICVFDIQTFQRFGFSRQTIPDDECQVFQTVTKLLALVEKSSRTLWYTTKQWSRLCTLTSVRRPLSWPFTLKSKCIFENKKRNSLVQSNKNNCQSHEHNSSYILWCADIGVFEVRFPIDQDRLNLTIILDLNLTFGSFKMILNHWEKNGKVKI